MSDRVWKYLYVLVIFMGGFVAALQAVGLRFDIPNNYNATVGNLVLAVIIALIAAGGVLRDP